MSESDFNEDFNNDDLYYWANAWSISNVCYAILVLAMVILAIQQRRRFRQGLNIKNHSLIFSQTFQSVEQQCYQKWRILWNVNPCCMVL